MVCSTFCLGVPVRWARIDQLKRTLLASFHDLGSPRFAVLGFCGWVYLCYSLSWGLGQCFVSIYCLCWLVLQ